MNERISTETASEYAQELQHRPRAQFQHVTTEFLLNTALDLLDGRAEIDRLVAVNADLRRQLVEMSERHALTEKKACNMAEALGTEIATLRCQLDEARVGQERVKRKACGSTYRVLSRAACLQSDTCCLDMRGLVVYQLEEEDGYIWIRPSREFCDQFEPLPPLPSAGGKP